MTAPEGRRATRTPGVLVAAALAALAVGTWTAWEPAAPSGTAGRVDVPSGLVADAPIPADATRLAWEHESPGPPGDEPPALVHGPVGSMLDDGLAGIDGLLVDVDANRTVGAAAPGAPDGHGLVFRGDGPDVVTVDVRTGEVVDRWSTGLGPEAALAVTGTLGDRSVLAVDGWTPVRGPMIVRHDGTVTPLEERQDAAVMATVDDDLVLVDDRPSGMAVLDARTGAAVARLDAPVDSPLVRSGDAVIGATDDGRLVVIDSAPTGAPGPAGAHDGPIATATIAGGDAFTDVRPIGVTGDRLVLHVRAVDDGGRQLVHVPRPPWPEEGIPATAVDEITAVEGTRSPWDPSFAWWSSPGATVPGDAAVVDDLVVVLDRAAGLVRAVGLDGRVGWERPAVDAQHVESLDGRLLLVRPTPSATTSELLDVTDGRSLWSGATTPASGGARLVAGVGGTFRVEAPSSGLAVLDATTGEMDVTADRGSRTLGHVADLDGDGIVPIVQTPDAGGSSVTVSIGEHSYTVDHVVDGGEAEVSGYQDGTLLVGRTDLRSPSDPLGDAWRPRWSELHRPDGSTVVLDDAAPAWTTWAVGVVPGLLAVWRDGLLTVIDPATGQERFTLPGASTVARAGEGRLVVLGRDLATWWLVDALDGDPVGDRREGIGRPVVGDGLVAAPGVASLVVVDALDGSVRWQADDAPIAPATVVLAGDHVLVGTRDGRVVEYDESGSVVRDLAVGTGPVTAIAWDAGTLAVAVDGVVRGFRADGSGLPEQEFVELP